MVRDRVRFRAGLVVGLGLELGLWWKTDESLKHHMVVMSGYILK